MQYARPGLDIKGCNVSFVDQECCQHSTVSMVVLLGKRLCGYDVTSLTFICGSTGSQYHSSNDTVRMLGIKHSVVKKLRDKIHELTIACADKLMKSRRMLERSSARQIRKRPRADPP